MTCNTGSCLSGVLFLLFVSMQACAPAALKEDLRLAASLSDEARLYYQQGENDRAEQLYRRSLAIREKALGPDHPDVATSLDNLAKLYQAQGKYAEAEPLLQRSLAIRNGATKRLGAKPPDRPKIPRLWRPIPCSK